MEDNPDDPLASQYSPSVLACYSSAYTFVALTDDLSKQHHVLAERLWFTFAHAFSCAVSLVYTPLSFLTLTTRSDRAWYHCCEEPYEFSTVRSIAF
jgi:hypothetical protein